MERRLAAILAADVVGYSRLMGADEAGSLAAALRQFRAKLFAPVVAIADPHGSIVKLMGDGGLGRVFWIKQADACK
jgi:adenylate cyclase